jgi:hypothetical protein
MFVSPDENRGMQNVGQMRSAEIRWFLRDGARRPLQNGPADFKTGGELHESAQPSTKDAMRNASATTATAVDIMPSHLSARGTGYNTCAPLWRYRTFRHAR